MKDRDERFWAALTTRIDAARRSDRSEEEQLADAERFLQATEDEPLRPELVQEVIDEVSGKREARQVATFPVGANLDRRWHMTRGAAAALIGSVLLLGGYAAMEFIGEGQLAPSKSDQLDFAQAVTLLQTGSESPDRIANAAHVVVGFLHPCVALLNQIKQHDMPALRASSTNALEELLLAFDSKTEKAPVPTTLEAIRSARQLLMNAKDHTQEECVEAINSLGAQCVGGILAVRQGIEILSAQDVPQAQIDAKVLQENLVSLRAAIRT